MRKYLAALFAAVVMALVLVPAPTASSQILWIGGEISHNYDYGYDRAFTVQCSGGYIRYVREYENSTKYCSDVNKIYVARGQEIWCKYPVILGSRYLKKFDATGWYGIADLFNDGSGCISRAD